MTRRPATPPPDDPEAPADPDRPTAPPVEVVPPATGEADLSSISLAGLTRRRVAWMAGFVAVAWVVIAISRQVGDVAAVSARADVARAANAGLVSEVSRLESELRLIQRPEFIAQQARAHRLGEADEIPFSLAAGAPPLPADAPGSRSVAVGAPTERPAPLEVWLDRLFGPGD